MERDMVSHLAAQFVPNSSTSYGPQTPQRGWDKKDSCPYPLAKSRITVYALKTFFKEN